MAIVEAGIEEVPPDGVDLSGLWQAWADDPDIRARVLKTGSLFDWPTKKTVGICAMDSVAMNDRVVLHMVRIWCNRMSAAKSIYVPHARAEAIPCLSVCESGKMETACAFV